ncbi:MAG: hypothetical protein MK098_15050 [Marinovum sp.]|nr:hypothetical protein [Marinovum sp.]
MATDFEYPPGSRVVIGDCIEGTVEELIFARGQKRPFLLVEYWQDGRLCSIRVHQEDAQPVKRRPA